MVSMEIDPEYSSLIHEDATALLEYYAPLRAWLREQNAGRTCGWWRRRPGRS